MKEQTAKRIIRFYATLFLLIIVGELFKLILDLVLVKKFGTYTPEGVLVNNTSIIIIAIATFAFPGSLEYLLGGIFGMLFEGIGPHIITFLIGFLLPALIAWGLWKQRKWGREATLVISILLMLELPLYYSIFYPANSSMIPIYFAIISTVPTFLIGCFGLYFFGFNKTVKNLFVASKKKDVVS